MVVGVASPPVCTIEVSALAATGGAIPSWTALAAIGLLLAGAAMLLLVHRPRRRTTGLRAVALLAAIALVVSPAMPAEAASVGYSSGCTLVSIDEGRVVRADPARVRALLPGDDTAVVTLVVANAFTDPIRLTGSGILDPTGAGALSAAVRFDGVEGPIVLQPGRSATVTLSVGVDPAAGDEAQATAAQTSLLITAIEAP